MPVAGYVCDLMCREVMLIIEVDGGQHDKQSAADQRRTKVLEAEGFRVLRFWNNEVIENTEGVLEAILLTLRECPPLPIAAASWSVWETNRPLRSQAGGESESLPRTWEGNS